MSSMRCLQALTFPNGGQWRRSWEIEAVDLSLGEVIGEGSYGEVFRGEWEGLQVAVKTVRDFSLFDSENRETSFAGLWNVIPAL